ncbi:MAG: hypothetical protein WEB30_10275 [Cyclobacteriaceae bacterium]
MTTAFVLCAIAGCYDDTEEALYGATICDLSQVTFSKSILPIISKSCYACHSATNAPVNGSGIVLEGYDKIIVAVNNGLLIESIIHGPDATAMPKGAPKLSDCTINTIKKWLEDGAMNN